MKKKLLATLALFTSLAIPFAYAQLAGTDRVQNNQWYPDNKELQFGNLPDVICKYDTAQTNDALVCGLSADSERFILTQKADLGTNFGLSDLNSPALTLMSANGLHNITIYHDGTNGVIDVDSGSVTFPDGIASSFTPDGMMSFASGAAPTGANYQIGRNNDGTNNIQLNVPTGAGFEFSVNATNELTLNATTADFQNNAITTTGLITSAGLSQSGLVTWSAGTAITNASTQVGRNSLDNLQLNVPSGQSLIFSVNGTNRLVFGTATADFQNANLSTTAAVSGGSVTSSGSLTSTSTTSIGWSIVTGANTACNTTCTNGCVHGWETTSGEVAVDCADATADKCLCAGAN